MSYKIPHLGLRMVKERTLTLPHETASNSWEAAAIASKLIGNRPVEYLIAILINNAGKVTGVTTIAQGGMCGMGAKAPDILRAVLTAQAAGFILAHNHPSGDPTPSAADIEFTAKVREAAAIVGCPMLDHIVVTADGSYRSVA